MIYSFLLQQKHLRVVECTETDIPSHIEKVFVYWKANNVDFNEQKLLLQEAVDNHSAWKVIDDTDATKAVIYCVYISPYRVMSNLLWIENKRMFAILAYHLRMNVRLQYINFLPHSKDYIPFKFVVEDYSMRLFHSHNQPLEINLWSNKSQKLYENHFKKYNIQVIA